MARLASLAKRARTSPDRARIGLTFDDGPDPDWTPRILDLLAEAGCHAIFFLVGCEARRHPGLVRRMVAEGHALGNHTWSHRHPWTTSARVARREVRDGAAAIADAAGDEPGYFRPPFGRLRRCMIHEATLAGERLMLWSLSARDWGVFGRRAQAIGRRLDKARPGDIVLMHDACRGINRPDQLVAVLPRLLERVASWPAASAPARAPAAIHG
jgi:peptidoglycan-N-acetylglucosamine deacetylase